MSAEPLRIYADFNGIVEGPRDPSRKAVVLDTFGSLRDLCNAGVVLYEGLPLIGVDESDEHEDLEGRGTAQYDRINKRWVIEFETPGIKYVPAGDRARALTFRCVSCKSQLPIDTPADAFRQYGACAKCNTPIMAPYDPPITAT